MLAMRLRLRDNASSIEDLEAKVAQWRQRFYLEEDNYHRDTQVKPAWDRAVIERERARHSGPCLHDDHRRGDLDPRHLAPESALELRPATDDFIVLGIGGSALGNRAVQRGLNPVTWNDLPRAERLEVPALERRVLDHVFQREGRHRFRAECRGWRDDNPDREPCDQHNRHRDENAFSNRGHALMINRPDCEGDPQGR